MAFAGGSNDERLRFTVLYTDNTRRIRGGSCSPCGGNFGSTYSVLHAG